MTLVSSWAGPDPHFVSQFAVRQSTLLEQGVTATTRSSSLFLFAPSFAAATPGGVEAWIEGATAHPGDPDIMTRRIGMVICTPPHASRELAESIPGARFESLPGGHLSYLEEPETFAGVVAQFLTDV